MKQKKDRNYKIVLILMVAIFGFFTACDNSTNPIGSTDPNGPNVPGGSTYTVIFEANGGTPVPQSQTVARGTLILEPAVMSRTGYGFRGWYTEAALTTQWNFATDTVTGNMTLYAKWGPPILVPGTSFEEKIEWLELYARSGGSYVIEVSTAVFTGPIYPWVRGGNNITLTLRGIGGNQVIGHIAGSAMFFVPSGVTLILESNLELRGGTGSIIYIDGGTLQLNNGVSLRGGFLAVNVRGNGNFSMYGGTIEDNNAVYVHDGTFTMHGGTIEDGGSGVSVGGRGSFTMNGGTIEGNTGDGVDVRIDGTFTMHGGTIEGNSHGVYVHGGTFTMNDGIIEGNTRSGVAVRHTGSLTMNGGTIEGNNNGGVSVSSGGSFTMNGGAIEGNTTGGGVSVSNSSSFASSFTMNGGTIKGNTATTGGGVNVSGGNSVFIKIGGTIFGYSAGDSSNVSVHNNGHAINVNVGVHHLHRDSTSGPEDNLLFDGRMNPPFVSGVWDN